MALAGGPVSSICGPRDFSSFCGVLPARDFGMLIIDELLPARVGSASCIWLKVLRFAMSSWDFFEKGISNLPALAFLRSSSPPKFGLNCPLVPVGSSVWNAYNWRAFPFPSGGELIINFRSSSATFEFSSFPSYAYLSAFRPLLDTSAAEGYSSPGVLNLAELVRS